MAMETIIGQCEEMSNAELIRAITIDRDTYTEAFFSIAGQELQKRGVALSEATNSVKVRIGERFIGALSIDEALKCLDELLHLWEMIRFTNCLDQKVAIQKGSLCWSGMVLSGEEMSGFLISSDEALKDIVRKILCLEEWGQSIKDVFNPDDWTTLSGEETLGFVNRLCLDLSRESIPASLKIDRESKAKACQDGQCKKGEGPLKVIVLKKDLEAAQIILDNLRQEVEKLYQEIEKLPEDSDRELELSLYKRLFELAPEDETVAFNLGVMLFEDEALTESIDAFIIAAFNRNDSEIREDAAGYLEEILEKTPENTVILHTLASLAMEKGDPDLIEGYYRRIIDLSPNDPVAHLNLGHFYYTDNRDDALAKNHFQRFLSIDPESDEAEQVRKLLTEIE